MCIIVAKPKHKAFPKKAIFEQCFRRNAHGSGFMYVKNGAVVIDKGYMTFPSFWDRYIELQNLGEITIEGDVVFHFRIATQGSVRKGTCHPFPISSSDAKLNANKLTVPIGFAHNGIIPNQTILAPDASDTQEFIALTLSKPWIKAGLKIQDAKAHNILKKDGGTSRFCTLTPTTMTRIGSGWVEDEGIFYSNQHYKVYIAPVRNQFYGTGYYDVVTRTWVYPPRGNTVRPHSATKNHIETTAINDWLDDLFNEFWETYMKNGLDYLEAVEIMTENHKEDIILTTCGKGKVSGYGCN